MDGAGAALGGRKPSVAGAAAASRQRLRLTRMVMMTTWGRGPLWFWGWGVCWDVSEF